MSKRTVRINHDYFSLSSRWENFKYFVQQGSILPHVADRVKWHYFPRYFITPGFPTHLEIEASSACQMRCPMCKTTQMIKDGIIFQGNMEFDLYKKIIDDCRDRSLYSIKLSWRGEPLLHPRITDMIAHAKEAGIRDVAFLTNGERLNPRLSRELVDSGLDWISISVDGMGEIYQAIRKPAIFEETHEKIRHLRACRGDRKKPLIRVQSIHSAIRGSELAFLNAWEGVADRVNFIADQKRSLDQKDYRHDPGYICPSPWQRMCIAWNGNVVQCYSDYTEANVLGDVKTQSLGDIWKGEPFRKLRELMKSGKRLSTKPCRTCSDGGVTEDEEVRVGNRKIAALHYKDQGIDVNRMISPDGK